MERTIAEGKLVVIEGGDGSGKATQLSELASKFQTMGLAYEEADFPQYGKTMYGTFVGQFLAGDFGELSDTDPLAAAGLYAGDRYEESRRLWASLKEGRHIISNRYVGSNLAHGGAKYPTLEEAVVYMEKVDCLEHYVYGIPRPDLNIYLHVPIDVAHRLVGEKKARAYTNGEARDIAEKDLEHQRKAIEMYEWLIENRENYVKVDCVDAEGNLLSIKEIHAKVWELVQPVIVEP